MSQITEVQSGDPEISAISLVYGALTGLDKDAQSRVLRYVEGKLGLAVLASNAGERKKSEAEPTRPDSEGGTPSSNGGGLSGDSVDDDGVSAVAKKWIQRNNLKKTSLAEIFSIGGDEIDLIAQEIPGKSKAARVRSVVLLKGVASYLGSGAARVSFQQVKETCLHYDAFDSTNFSKHLKDISSEISGNKESGFTLTARGLAEATTLVKEMLGP